MGENESPGVLIYRKTMIKMNGGCKIRTAILPIFQAYSTLCVGVESPSPSNGNRIVHRILPRFRGIHCRKDRVM